MAVGVLESGRSFGELSLISNKARAATIRCEEPTHFATLDKATYEKVFAKLEEISLNEKIDLLKTVEVFQNWSRTGLSKITYYLKERQYQRNYFVCKEGEEAENVYLISSGEFEVHIPC